MNSKIHLLSIAPVAAWLLTACNYTDGPCWRRGEGSEGAGAGTGDGSVILSSGSGDFGDTPPQGNGDPPLKCNEDDEDNKDSHSDSPKNPPQNPPQSQCLGVGDTAGDGSTFSSCSVACTSTCPAASIVGCGLRVDYPHESTHFPGTVNVVAEFTCNDLVASIEMAIGLTRDGQEVAYQTFVGSGVKTLERHVATSLPCVDGAYQGGATAVVTFPFPSFPATGTLHANSAIKQIICKR
jgi:hypothetical protein